MWCTCSCSNKDMCSSLIPQRLSAASDHFWWLGIDGITSWSSYWLDELDLACIISGCSPLPEGARAWRFLVSWSCSMGALVASCPMDKGSLILFVGSEVPDLSLKEQLRWH